MVLRHFAVVLNTENPQNRCWWKHPLPVARLVHIQGRVAAKQRTLKRLRMLPRLIFPGKAGL
ncbi:hypothetical protein THS27_08570 [Thalassospira sp. MCCC 1A01428]|nr:hypothetical protein THS27_08570 [Thalassospira sp. MCCC 1A01428]